MGTESGQGLNKWGGDFGFRDGAVSGNSSAGSRIKFWPE